MNYLRKIITNRSFFHIVFWLALYLLTFFAILRFEDIRKSVQISLILIAPIIIPVYIHSFTFKKFFQQKRYYLYVIISTTIVFVFGYLNQMLFDFYETNSETYLTLIIFMAMFTGFKYLKIGTKQQFQLQEEEKKRIKAENEFLKSQVNPHFMFNTLNSIYSLIIDKDDLAGDAVLKLSGLMRYLLDSSKNSKVSLTQETEFIRNYIELEKIRLDDRCQINFEIKGDLKNKSIAPMLLIPFIENAFKHGISASAEKNLIRILLDIEKSKINLYVENGIAPKRIVPLEKSDETGIKNVTKRLMLLHPGKHEVKIEQTDAIFKINLQIEL